MLSGCNWPPVDGDRSECLLSLATWSTTKLTSRAFEGGLSHEQRPAQVFFQDCGLETARSAAEQVVPQITETLQTPVRISAWRSIPCMYIACELDQAVPSTIQYVCARRIRALNRDFTVIGMQSGHAPFLSKVRETARLIVQAAGQ